ncbi:MAG TPA: ATP-binding protein [Anaeromyxobacteraceae bacterium]|nr:ATP-binding protein [Anaeromyxobacteraceae bacterium]
MRAPNMLAPEQPGGGDAERGEIVRLGRRTALRIVVVYLLVGAAWVLFSDRVLATIVSDPAARDRLQTVKGASYVLATGALLYWLIVRARSHLAASELERRAVLDSIVDAIVVVDPSGTVVDLNAAAARLAGLSQRNGRGLPLAELLARGRFKHLDGRPLAVEDSATSRALQGETVGGFECTVQGPDGSTVFTHVSASPVYVQSGAAPHRAVAVIRDVTDVRRFEVAREEFLSTAAHELKTPLAVTKAYAQLMKRRGQGDPAALSVIERQTDRLARIVQQLLEVSRFRSGRGGELRRERFDLGDVADDVAQRMRRLTVDPVRVERSDAILVLADPDRIAQVMVNLVENAIRFSPLGGEVAIAVRRRATEAVVSVRDHGVGIPPERQDRVFERFYRAHAGTSQDYGGLGLGLDVSREIVARHGGRMWFESEPGQGSTFSFSLPIAEETAA